MQNILNWSLFTNGLMNIFTAFILYHELLKELFETSLVSFYSSLSIRGWKQVLNEGFSWRCPKFRFPICSDLLPTQRWHFETYSHASQITEQLAVLAENSGPTVLTEVSVVSFSGEGKCGNSSQRKKRFLP